MLMLIHVDVWQKSSQYCKAIILQLKKNNTGVGYRLNTGDILKVKLP